MKSQFTSSCGARLIAVAPGSFIMGSPPDEVGRAYWETERQVTLPHAFYLSATPLTTAVVHRHRWIIRTLVDRGADTTRALKVAQRGLAGDFDDDPRLDREGYREIIELLRELGVE